MREKQVRYIRPGDYLKPLEGGPWKVLSKERQDSPWEVYTVRLWREGQIRVLSLAWMIPFPIWREAEIDE